MAETDYRLLVLDPADNVVIACRDLESGTELVLDGLPLRLEASVPTGHKLARHDIAAGEKVLKYGAPIGSARGPITRGSYVHTHNLKSDYIPTWARDGSEMR